ncbi:hypothetical protein JW766_02140 [Candidatus Dojkabacteria bacterium]|nr:hypothetical protein [Candidatus Dojkabacteria bacterium]
MESHEESAPLVTVPIDLKTYGFYGTESDMVFTTVIYDPVDKSINVTDQNGGIWRPYCSRAGLYLIQLNWPRDRFSEAVFTYGSPIHSSQIEGRFKLRNIPGTDLLFLRTDVEQIWLKQ